MREGLAALTRRLDWRWYGWLTLLAAGLYQLSLPIAVLDTDMWYHLSDGRYFLENGEWPSFTYFSFMDPPRELQIHWWLYQPVVTKLFEVFGYQGLVFLRSGAFLLACYFLYRLLLDGDSTSKRNAISLFVFALVVVILHYRGFQLRPYLFTYIFIAAFLFILERKPKYVYVLPFLSVLWANIHGISWPIAAIICSAYFVEWLYVTYRLKERQTKRDQRYALALVLCGLCFLLNPSGPAIFLKPFLVMPDLSKFIGEMEPLSPRVLTQFVAEFGSIRNISAVSIFFAMLVFAILNLALNRKLKLSHLLLLIGGTLLLMRAGRFLQVWMLLSLPLVRCFAQNYQWQLRWNWAPSTIAVVMALIWVMVLPIHTFVSKIDRQRPYPFDWTTAPAGVTKFLEQHDDGGNILAEPGMAGYLEWYLLPHYKVYADMRLNRYSYKGLTAFRSESALKRFQDSYRIDYILVPRTLGHFVEEIGRKAGFVPVFFDDRTALLANSDNKPKIVKQFGYQTLDFKNLLKELSLDNEADDAARQEKKTTRQEALQRTVDVYAEGNLPRLLLVKHLFETEAYDEAEHHVDLLLERYPNDVNGLSFKGYVLESTDRCQEALGYFERALKTPDRAHRLNVLKHIGSCHYLLRNHAKAYEALHEALNPYLRVEPPEYLYQYAFVSAYEGRIDRAIRMLELLLLTLEESDETAELKEKSEVFLDKLRGPIPAEIVDGPVFSRLFEIE